MEPTGTGVPGAAPSTGTGTPWDASADIDRRTGQQLPAVRVGPHRRLDRGVAPDPAPGPWWVVVPVKDTVRGKSRIAAPVEVRRSVARALATDTVAAAGATDEVAVVLVVAENDRDARMTARVGARTVLVPSGGLAAALAAGIAVVPVGAPVAVLLGDLPAVRPAELSAVLRAVRSGDTAFVRDTAGTGTTLLAARDAPLRPRFGDGSAALHRGAGFRDLVADGGIGAGLRRDVDTLTDLWAVLEMPGLGSATAALLGRDDVRAALTGHRPAAQHGARPRC